MTLSVVLPVSNERDLDVLPRIARVLAPLHAEGFDCIAVDNASRDGTAELLRDAGWRVIALPGSNRAQRLNAGIRAARRARVLLHHPRSLIAADTVRAIAALPPEAVWGACTHGFDDDHPLLRWTSFWSNRVRLDRRGIAYLDHCIFLPRDLLPPPAVPEIDVFEDTALSLRLRRHARPLRLPERAVTSSVRYARNGVWRQTALNQLMKAGYALRLPHGWMNRVYERGLELNGARRDTP